MCAPFYRQPALSGYAAENIRNQAFNIPDNLLISFFSVNLPLRFDTGNPAWFANISDGPYARAVGKGYAPQALVVDSLIHTDCNIRLIQARLSQLIAVAGFSKASYAVSSRSSSVILWLARFRASYKVAAVPLDRTLK